MPPRASAGPYPAPVADEIVLVLAAEGIAATLEPTAGGLAIVIDEAEARRAETILADEYPTGVHHAFAARAAAQAAARARIAAPAQTEWFGPGSWVIFLLTAVCIGVFLAEERAGGSELREVLLRFGASRPAHVRGGEWWRFATALFVHIGPRHLLGNMAALLVLGPALVAALGPWRFLFVYLAAGIAGNALSCAVTPPDTVSAGASGAILGVLGALGGQRLRFAASARYRGWQVVAAVLAYLAIGVGAGPGVDTMAHLGGLVAGLALGLGIPPPARATTASPPS
ncbi:MAG: rhomboid family intramembrane serine protease [Deltaproteobacteria bacterium]|nr:rhomboid family intramembrane serine protease [Deltaproteobacteria bacterium]